MKDYSNTPAIGIYGICNFGGIEILDITDDFVVSAYNFGEGRGGIKKSKLYYTSTGKAYFIKGNKRIYLDTIMRVDR